ncbi:MAG: hypothetical protein WDA71_01420 [Actinomycetota bacterium]
MRARMAAWLGGPEVRGKGQAARRVRVSQHKSRRGVPRIPLVLMAVAVASTLAVSAGADSGGPPPDPAPGSTEWQARDTQNMLDATGRLQDQYTNPAFHKENASNIPGAYGENLSRQLADPTRPTVSLGQSLPGARTADPFRIDWQEQGRGIRYDFTFLNRYGARLAGILWAPNPDAPNPLTGKPMHAPYPAVVITDGSIQAYQELYFWAAQGLAEAGYLVMTFDPQGQGESEVFGHDSKGNIWCDGLSSETPPQAPPSGAEQNPSCPGFPFQQTANFVYGTEDALGFFFSTRSAPYHWYRPDTGTLAYNPWAALIDREHVGIAGHSLGAGAVSIIQAYDRRVQAVVAWDNLSTGEPASDGGGGAPPSLAPWSVTSRVPALGITADYGFNVQQTSSQPAPKDGGFQKWKKAGIDTMEVSLVHSTHLDFSYIPFILPASKDGERVAFHYTLAWFDRYLKGVTDPTQRADATRRLTAGVFDASADTSAIGAGAWDVATNSNVPYKIAGDPVWEHLSFYQPSEYWLDKGKLACTDMRRDTSCAARASKAQGSTSVLGARSRAMVGVLPATGPRLPAGLPLGLLALGLAAILRRFLVGPKAVGLHQ